jgi:competence protein ComEC
MNGNRDSDCSGNAAESTLAILDVGHGSSAVITSPAGTVVIDTGPGSALLEYLQEQRITEVGTVVLSHADQDHIGALAQLLALPEVRVGRVFLNTDSEKSSEAWNDLLYELDGARRRGEAQFIPAFTTNDSGTLDLPGIQMEVLAPTPYLAAKGPGSTDKQGRRITSHTVSAVIRVTTDDGPVALLTGDLDVLGLVYLTADRDDVAAPVLVFPHHGGRAAPGNDDAFARDLCTAVKPKMVIFSTGRGRYAMPKPETIDGVLDVVPGSWIACTQLAEACAADLPVAAPTHLAPASARGRESGVCCAGSIVIPLTDLGNVQPSREGHLSFVGLCAPAALCRR